MPDQAGDGFDRMTFEQLLAALEALTDRLASSDVGIEEAADLYEQAERLHGLAAERLARVQARIETLSGRSPASGPPGTPPVTPPITPPITPPATPPVTDPATRG